MNSSPVIRDASELTPAWLGAVLGQPVDALEITAGHGNWSRQFSIRARLGDGTTRTLRLKLCLGNTFGRSEVDYYTRDYLGLPNAPLVRCFDAQFANGFGYHLLLEDLAATHTDRRDAPGDLAYGLAVAEALARLHRHHWCSQPAPHRSAIDRYLDEVRPGLEPLERATGCTLLERFERHEQAFRRRWAQGEGMSLLHGDLNPTNILTPPGRATPLYFLDRQPFDWSLTYGVAASDLACFMIPWWPEPTTEEHAMAVLRRWYDVLDVPGYGWTQAQADWWLSVEQCLNVPMEWCSKPDTLARMQWLWQAQFSRVQHALALQPSLDVPSKENPCPD